MPRPPLLKYGTCWLGSPVYFHYRLIMSFKNCFKNMQGKQSVFIRNCKEWFTFLFQIKEFSLKMKKNFVFINIAEDMFSATVNLWQMP